MNNSKIIKVLLVLAGIIGIYVGGSLLFFPAELQAQSNIIINKPSQFSEARAPGAAIFSASFIILLGVFREGWRYIALVIATMFFLSYGLGRMLSLILDGRPAQGLFIAMILELFVGLLTLLALIKVKKAQNKA